jgi:hypothetical protein
MRRLLGWVSGALGGITAYRLLRRRQAGEVAPEADGRADELRAKLAESRVAADTAEPAVEEPVFEEASAEEPLAEPEPSEEAESPDDRRRRVHEEGRAAIDEMKPE